MLIQLALDFPSSFEYRAPQFKSHWPYFRITNKANSEQLLKRIIKAVMHGKAEHVKVANLKTKTKELVERVVSDKNAKLEDVLKGLPNSNAVLVLRGLLIYDILVHAL